MRRSNVSAWVVSVAAFCATGCSSFHREWEEALKKPVPPDRITGPWTGTWQNQNNTHGNALRAVVTELEPDTYRAFFHARYLKIFTYSYSVKLSGRPEGDSVILTGEEDLGKLAGGVYKYNGHANPTNFFCDYESKYNTGTFTLQRPKP